MSNELLPCRISTRISVTYRSIPPLDTKSLIELGLPADIIGIEAKKAKGLVGANKARFTPIIFILGSGKEEFR